MRAATLHSFKAEETADVILTAVDFVLQKGGLLWYSIAGTLPM